MVMGGNSRSEGREFESWCHILDGHFFTLICCKIVLMFVWKRPKINEKEARLAHFFLKKRRRWILNRTGFLFTTLRMTLPVTVLLHVKFWQNFFPFCSYQFLIFEIQTFPSFFHLEENPKPVWPDLAKFCHFGKILNVFCNFSRFYLLFSKILNLLWQRL